MKNLVNVLEGEDLVQYTHEEWYGVEIKEEETMKNYTVESLVEILKANNWQETEITCPDGATVFVTPCTYGEVESLDDIDYFLVDGDIPWMGDSHIEKVVEEINNHAKLVEELNGEQDKLRKYFEEGEADGWTNHDWDWYSDWHKDVYGYRPHGHVCGEYVRPW